jgi:hypothetical protein
MIVEKIAQLVLGDSPAERAGALSTVGKDRRVDE